jgi:transcriptional regulator with XRE-family HTH domain
MERIGGTLRAIRLQRKLSLREVEQRCSTFAQQSGDNAYRISASWLGRLEKNPHGLTVSKLLVLAHIYDVKPEQLLSSNYPNPLDKDPPPDETTLIPPESEPAPYLWGVIGKHDRTLEPLIPAGSVVQIDTRRREISQRKERARELERPIFFLRHGDDYFCGWCDLDPSGELLTLVPHPLSTASSHTWRYRKQVEVIGRVVAVIIRFTPA